MNRYRRRFLLLLISLILAWLLWSGIYTPLLLGFGALSCFACLYVAHRIGFLDEAFSLQVILRLPGYWGWLLLEMIRSSFDVARIILHPKMPISPAVVTCEAGTEDPVGQAVLGNSITLSPGTVTLDVHDGQLQIHCLTEEAAESVLRGEFTRRAAGLTGE